MMQVIPKVLVGRYAKITAAVLLFYTLAGFVAVPMCIEWFVPWYARQSLHCRTRIAKVHVNPFLLTFEATGVSMSRENGRPLFAFARLFADFGVSSLFHWAPVLQRLDLDSPSVWIGIESDGSVNFESLAAPPAQPGTVPSADSLFPFILRNAAVHGGRIVIVDRRQRDTAKLILQAIDLQVRDLAQARDGDGLCQLTFRTDGGAGIRWDGRVYLAPFHSRGRLWVNGLRAADLWQFVRDKTNLEPPGGLIDVETGYLVQAGNGPFRLALDGLHLLADDLTLRLADTEEDVLRLNKLDLEVPQFDSATGKVEVGRLLLAGGALDVHINETGEINLARLVHVSGPSPAQGEGTAVRRDERTASPAVRIHADDVLLQEIAVRLDDWSRKVPVQAEIANGNLRLHADLVLGDGQSVVLHNISSEIYGMRLQGIGSPGPLFTAERLSLAEGSCESTERRLRLGRLVVSNGRLSMPGVPQREISTGCRCLNRLQLHPRPVRRR